MRRPDSPLDLSLNYLGIDRAIVETERWLKWRGVARNKPVYRRNEQLHRESTSEIQDTAISALSFAVAMSAGAVSLSMNADDPGMALPMHEALMGATGVGVFGFASILISKRGPFGRRTERLMQHYVKTVESEANKVLTDSHLPEVGKKQPWQLVPVHQLNGRIGLLDDLVETVRDEMEDKVGKHLDRFDAFTYASDRVWRALQLDRDLSAPSL